MTKSIMKFLKNMKNKILTLLLFGTFFNFGFSQTYTTGVVSLSNTAGLTMTAKIDVSSQVTLTLTGPAGRWFSVGFNASSMTSGTDVVSAHSAGALTAFDCNLTGYSAPVSDAQQNWTITSDAVNVGVRTIVATRALNTGDANDYIFPALPSSISLIWARSNSASFSYAYHGSMNRGITVANFTLLSPPAAPTGSATQTYCSGSTIAQLSASGTAIQWYSSPSGGSPLPTNTVLIDGSTYYASQTVNSLESNNRLAVSVSIDSIPTPPSTINGSIDFCYSGSSQQYTISSVLGATSYVWTTPIGSTGSSTGTIINLLFLPSFQTGTLSVKALNSCGQSANTSITINQHLPSSQTLNVTTCNPYFFNGQNLTQTGTYLYQGSTIWGCDSTVVLNLDYGTPIIQNLSDQACGSYAWNGQSYFSSGIYVDTFPAVSGCDSIVALDLTIYPIEVISIDSTVLDIFTWNGISYTTSGSYSQYFTSFFGCDSTVTINLTIQSSGLEESDQELTIYPNPIGESRILSIEGLSSPINFEILNLQGKIIQAGSLVNNLKLVENITSGIYFITIQQRRYKILIE
jgi:hypothetical protein